MPSTKKTDEQVNQDQDSFLDKLNSLFDFELEFNGLMGVTQSPDDFRFTNLDNSDLNFLISRIAGVITEQLQVHHALSQVKQFMYVQADKEDTSEKSAQAFELLNKVRDALRMNKQERAKLSAIQRKLKQTRAQSF